MTPPHVYSEHQIAFEFKREQALVMYPSIFRAHAVLSILVVIRGAPLLRKRVIDVESDMSTLFSGAPFPVY